MTEETNSIVQEKAENQYINDVLPMVESWYTTNDKDYFFNFKAIRELPSGLYSMTVNENNGYGLTLMDYEMERYFYLPSLPHNDIINLLQNFWDKKDKFLQYKINPRRGIIVYGESGCGKSSLVYLLVEELKKRNGIAIYLDIPESWRHIAPLIRKVEKSRPLLCILEDLDLLIQKHGEEVFLNFLDGINSIDNVVYLATTNNLNSIPDRIKERPSRFDKKFEIKKPTKEDRLVYFNSCLKGEDLQKYDIDTLVKDTEGFTMAHLKEVFISLYILDNEYHETIKALKKSKIGEPIGFVAKVN